MSKAFAGLKAVHELRFHLCQTSKHSEGARIPPKIVRKVKSGESDHAGVDQRSARGGTETVREIR